jgi:protein-tyrosine phosphatase
MIDTHCHILPGIDDGPEDAEESVEMARIAARDGINKIIATPHIYDMRYSPEEIAQRVDRLNRLLTQKNIPVEVHPGAEVFIGMDPHILFKYAIQDTPYILIEFPHDHLPAHAGKLLQWLSDRGLKPIIAHPERNHSVIRSPETLLRLLNKDIYVQITGDSLTGEFGPDIQYCAHFLMESGKVDIIASDAHAKKFRAPVLSRAEKATARRFGEKASERLFQTNPEAVLTGREILRDEE